MVCFCSGGGAVKLVLGKDARIVLQGVRASEGLGCFLSPVSAHTVSFPESSHYSTSNGKGQDPEPQMLQHPEFDRLTFAYYSQISICLPWARCFHRGLCNKEKHAVRPPFPVHKQDVVPRDVLECLTTIGGAPPLLPAPLPPLPRPPAPVASSSSNA